MATILTVKFVHEKDTKNTEVFAEVPDEGKPEQIGKLYIQKGALTEVPSKITVTVKDA